MELPGGEGPIRPDGVVGLATRRRSAGSLAGLLSWMIQRLPLRRHLLRASTPSAPSSPTERGSCRSRQTLVPCSPPEGVLSVARVTTSSSTFGPGLPSPSPVPSLPFLTTSTACSACAVQVCCTLQPTMGSAWFPASSRYPPVSTRLSTSNPVPKERGLCGPHGVSQRVSSADSRPLQAASVIASRSRKASVAGRRRKTIGGGRDRSGAASEDGLHVTFATTALAAPRAHPAPPCRGAEARRLQTPRGWTKGQSDAPEPTRLPCLFLILRPSLSRRKRRIAKSARTTGSSFLFAPFPQARSPFEAFPSAAAGVRVTSAPAFPSLRRRKRLR